MRTYGNGAVVVQTVEREGNPFLYDVLRILQEDVSRSSSPALQSVSIPLQQARDLRSIFQLMCLRWSPEHIIDHLVLEGYLFSRPCTPSAWYAGGNLGSVGTWIRPWRRFI